MARIQILELPMEEGDDGKVVTPFLLIVDEYTGPTDVPTVEAWQELAKRCGARHIFLIEDRIDLVGPTPEEIAASSQRTEIGTATVKVEPDLSGFEAAITAAIERAQNAIVDALTPPKITISPEFAAHRARRTQELLDKTRTDDNRPCRAELSLDETNLRCERPFNHDDIHEAQIKNHSYLRWSYAGRRVLPLE